MTYRIVLVVIALAIVTFLPLVLGIVMRITRIRRERREDREEMLLLLRELVRNKTRG